MRLRCENDVPAFTTRHQQADLLKRAEMRRERVVRHGQQPADIAGGEPVRPITHQEPKDLQARRLRQRAQERDRIRRGQP